MENIAISIICLTYNQKRYIKDAIKGFLNQKTNFEYEIIVHDDASTDGTVEILKEYKHQYPEKINLILEEENQYSKGTRIVKDIIYPVVRGKYIAFCEGDDYWIYENKLQKQYELMEAHPEISACYHNALMYAHSPDQVRLNVNNQSSGYINDEDIICTTKGWYPTASLFARADSVRKQFVLNPSTGDEGMRNLLACQGRLYYINKVWSVYREFTNGGWNTRYYNNKELATEHFKKTILYFQEFNEYSHGRFNKYIPKRLFQAIDKYRDAHYGVEKTVKNLKNCIDDLANVAGLRINNVLDAYYAIYAIRCKDYYKVTIEEKIKKNDNIYIYGAGVEAVKALIELDRYNILPKGFIVSNKKSISERVLGIPVYGIDEFVFSEDKQIWPCLVKGREEVIRDLNKKDCKNIIY